MMTRENQDRPVCVARLDSWKSIAHYLGRSIRTVQRWSKGLRLPVYHVGACPGHSPVYAYTSELDAWFRKIATDEAAISSLPGPGVVVRDSSPIGDLFKPPLPVCPAIDLKLFRASNNGFESGPVIPLCCALCLKYVNQTSEGRFDTKDCGQPNICPLSGKVDPDQRV